MFIIEEESFTVWLFIANFRTRRVSHTETVSSTETRISRVVETHDTQPTYIPSSEQHSMTITTDVSRPYDVKPIDVSRPYDIKPIQTRETHATTLKADVQPKYQPIDLTISVPVPPKFVQVLKNIETMEGTRVTFEGIVTGKDYLLERRPVYYFFYFARS